MVGIATPIKMFTRHHCYMRGLGAANDDHPAHLKLYNKLSKDGYEAAALLRMTQSEWMDKIGLKKGECDTMKVALGTFPCVAHLLSFSRQDFSQFINVSVITPVKMGAVVPATTAADNDGQNDDERALSDDKQGIVKNTAHGASGDDGSHGSKSETFHTPKARSEKNPHKAQRPTKVKNVIHCHQADPDITQQRAKLQSFDDRNAKSAASKANKKAAANVGNEVVSGGGVIQIDARANGAASSDVKAQVDHKDAVAGARDPSGIDMHDKNSFFDRVLADFPKGKRRRILEGFTGPELTIYHDVHGCYEENIRPYLEPHKRHQNVWENEPPPRFEDVDDRLLLIQFLNYFTESPEGMQCTFETKVIYMQCVKAFTEGSIPADVLAELAIHMKAWTTKLLNDDPY